MCKCLIENLPNLKEYKSENGQGHLENFLGI